MTHLVSSSPVPQSTTPVGSCHSAVRRSLAATNYRSSEVVVWCCWAVRCRLGTWISKKKVKIEFKMRYYHMLDVQIHWSTRVRTIVFLPSQSPYFRMKKKQYDECFCLSMNMLAQSFISTCILFNATINYQLVCSSIGKKKIKKSISIDEHCSECPNQYRREKHARNVMQ